MLTFLDAMDYLEEHTDQFKTPQAKATPQKATPKTEPKAEPPAQPKEEPREEPKTDELPIEGGSNEDEEL